jgi:hypothetical protein
MLSRKLVVGQPAFSSTAVAGYLESAAPLIERAADD